MSRATIRAGRSTRGGVYHIAVGDARAGCDHRLELVDVIAARDVAESARCMRQGCTTVYCHLEDGSLFDGGDR